MDNAWRTSNVTCFARHEEMDSTGRPQGWTRYFLSEGVSTDNCERGASGLVADEGPSLLGLRPRCHLLSSQKESEELEPKWLQISVFKTQALCVLGWKPRHIGLLTRWRHLLSSAFCGSQHGLRPSPV